MHDIFLCDLYIPKHFGRMLNSLGFKFMNISENKVLVNNSEFTVLGAYKLQVECSSTEHSGSRFTFHSILNIPFFPWIVTKFSNFARSGSSIECTPALHVTGSIFRSSNSL